MDTSGEGIGVIGAVDVFAAPETPAGCGQAAHIRGGSSVRSLSGTPVGSGGAEALGQVPNGVEGLGVAGDALGRPLAGVHDRRVVAPAEAPSDRGQRLARVLARQ